MKIGYIRISSADQNTARQEVLMQELGIEEVFIDRMSGKSTDRSTFDAVVAKWRVREITAVEAMRRLDMKASTFYRRVKGGSTRVNPLFVPCSVFQR